MLHRSLKSFIETLGGYESSNGAQCKCPLHEDKKESLSLTIKDDNIVFHCHAGCDQSALRAYFQNAGLIRQRKTRSSNMSKPKLKLVGEPEAIYSYTKEGEVLAQKLRYPDKQFTIRRPAATASGWENRCFSAEQAVLYNADLIQERSTIYLCEGEKDADNLNSLKLPDVVATTNIEGANGWKDRYSRLLAGKDVVIFEDNDPAGKSRTEKLTSQLSPLVSSLKVVSFPDLPEKSDVTNWLQQFSTIPEARLKLDELIQASTEIPISPSTWCPPADREKAIHEDYVDYLHSRKWLKEVRLDLLSRKLMAKKEDGRWYSVTNMDSALRAESELYGDFFKKSAIAEHLDLYREHEAKPQLLIDIPEWDGVDRLQQQAEVFEFYNLTQQQAYEIFCAWGAQIFKRLRNPDYQPACLVLHGPQGAGKDALIKAWTRALEMYHKNLTVQPHKPEEAMRQLDTALVFNIPEFERISTKAGAATIKDLVTRTTTNERKAYAREDEERLVRAVFIASSNSKDIFTDDTGARRFWIMECKYLGFELKPFGDTVQGTGQIEKSYPGLFDRANCHEESQQILAQWQHLAAQNYNISKETFNALLKTQENLTPESVSSLILEDFNDILEEHRHDYWKRHHETGQILLLAKNLKVPTLELLQEHKGWNRCRLNKLLKIEGRYFKYGKCWVYAMPSDSEPNIQEPDSEGTEELFTPFKL